MPGGLDDRLGTLDRLTGLENARTDEYTIGPQLHHHGGVGGGGNAPGSEQNDGKGTGTGDLSNEIVGGLQLLCRDVEFIVEHGGQPTDFVEDSTHVRDGVRDVSGARLTFGAHHRSAFRDTTQGLTEVGGTAHEGDRELPLIDVVGIIGRGQHLRLINKVHPEGLQYLGLGKVSDAGLRHDRDRDGRLDTFDHVRVGHARDSTLRSDIGGHTFEGHDGDGAGVLSDARLIRGDDIHDDPALEHVGHAALDAGRAGEVRNRSGHGDLSRR